MANRIGILWARFFGKLCIFNIFFALMPTAGNRAAAATTAHVKLSISTVTVETRLSDLGNNSLWNH